MQMQRTVVITITTYLICSVWSYVDPCSLNGDLINGNCQCDAGWKGNNCTLLKLGPVSINAPGYFNTSLPTWSGGNIYYDSNEYHLFVAARAIKNTKDDLYECNSNIIHLVSNESINGPFNYKNTVLKRMNLNPFTIYYNGTYIIFDEGYYDNIPSIEECENYNTSKITYNQSYSTIHVTYSNNINAPFSEWQDNQYVIFDPFPGPDNRTRWDCYAQNPTAYIYPNGTTIMIYRGTQCDPYNRMTNSTKEHIGIAIADHWKGPYKRITNEQPLFGYKPHNEDPFLWRNARGFHLLMHSQNNTGENHKTRGGYAYSKDGISWTLSADDPWVNFIMWDDGTNVTFTRRQKPGLIFDENNNPIYLINGVDLNGTDGTKWQTGWTLIQPIIP